jgi:hypothetical protein
LEKIRHDERSAVLAKKPDLLENRCVVPGGSVGVSDASETTEGIVNRLPIRFAGL